VLVIGANLCMDRTLRMQRLTPGAVQRPRSADLTAGGKAVNVCRAAKAHGLRPRLVGTLPGLLGRYVGDLLDREGHDVRRVVTRGEIRSATIILEDDLRATVLNEPGPALIEPDRSIFLSVVGEELRGHRVVVMTGSLPPGRHQDLYGDLVDIAAAQGVLSIVDAARGALVEALPHHPDVVTPNMSEAQAVLAMLRGDAPTTPVDESVEPDSTDVRAEAFAAARALRAAGARAALVTAGRHGVAAVHEGREYWVAAPSVTQVNPIGAGDAFAAGLGAGLELGETLEQASVRAVASGSSSVTTPLAGDVDRGLLAELLASVKPEPA
jgi:1-phosphofructokinase family hexose kinase